MAMAGVRCRNRLRIKYCTCRTDSEECEAVKNTFGGPLTHQPRRRRRCLADSLFSMRRVGGCGGGGYAGRCRSLGRLLGNCTTRPLRARRIHFTASAFCACSLSYCRRLVVLNVSEDAIQLRWPMSLLRYYFVLRLHCTAKKTNGLCSPEEQRCGHDP